MHSKTPFQNSDLLHFSRFFQISFLSNLKINSFNKSEMKLSLCIGSRQNRILTMILYVHVLSTMKTWLQSNTFPNNNTGICGGSSPKCSNVLFNLSYTLVMQNMHCLPKNCLQQNIWFTSPTYFVKHRRKVAVFHILIFTIVICFRC